jgi:hypothetical protein
MIGRDMSVGGVTSRVAIAGQMNPGTKWRAGIGVQDSSAELFWTPPPMRKLVDASSL